MHCQVLIIFIKCITTIQLNHYFATFIAVGSMVLVRIGRKETAKPNKNKKHIGVTILKHSWTHNYYVAVGILGHGKHICFSSSVGIRKCV